jgi:hypothetical protein
MNYGALDAAKVALAAGGVGLVVGLIAVPTLVVGPWIVKAVKPEWSYGRRLAASFAFSTLVGALVRIARAASGTEKAATMAAAPKEAEVPKAASTTFIPSSASTAPR